MTGFFKVMRSESTVALLRDPNAFMLLFQIAMRARRTDALNLHGLGMGEALIGDHESIGLTRGQYRQALKRLERYGEITTRATSRGTIARIEKTDVFDINIQESCQPASQPAASGQPSRNQETAANKKEKKEENKEKEKAVQESGRKPESGQAHSRATQYGCADAPGEDLISLEQGKAMLSEFLRKHRHDAMEGDNKQDAAHAAA